jgi:hypothetical protein
MAESISRGKLFKDKALSHDEKKKRATVIDSQARVVASGEPCRLLSSTHSPPPHDLSAPRSGFAQPGPVRRPIQTP